MSKYRVKNASGNEIQTGDEVISFRGVPAEFVGVERGPEHNRTAKVRVKFGAPDSPDRTVRSYYASVFDLTVSPIE